MSLRGDILQGFLCKIHWLNSLKDFEDNFLIISKRFRKCSSWESINPTKICFSSDYHCCTAWNAQNNFWWVAKKSAKCASVTNPRRIETGQYQWKGFFFKNVFQSIQSVFCIETFYFYFWRRLIYIWRCDWFITSSTRCKKFFTTVCEWGRNENCKRCDGKGTKWKRKSSCWSCTIKILIQKREERFLVFFILTWFWIILRFAELVNLGLIMEERVNLIYFSSYLMEA